MPAGAVVQLLGIDIRIGKIDVHVRADVQSIIIIGRIVEQLQVIHVERPAGLTFRRSEVEQGVISTIHRKFA